MLTTREILNIISIEPTDMTEDKARLYRTAKADLSCAHFRKGDYVSIEYARTVNGTVWFHIAASQDGKLPCVVAYPAHHLCEFCL